MAEKKPIGRDIVARMSGALSTLFGSADSAWMGPLNPLPPNVPQEQQASVRGRVFDFPVGFNTRVTPRMGEAVTFPQMRALAENCDILRMVIETRKDQLSKYKFSIARKEKAGPGGVKKLKPDARCQEVEDFFAMPDGENLWQDWLRMISEEMLVTDALSIYPWLNNDGTPFRFNVIDGATIKRNIDELGRTPASPLAAYQQVLKGIVAANYTSDELLYAPRNKRVHKVYGYSPVEQIIMTVNIAIRRSVHQLQYYTEGSTPDLLFQVPADWNMAQIKEFNDWWQDSLSGNTAARRKAQFVPNGVTPINTKEGILKDPYDEWLARIICYCFNVSHQAFIKENNRSTSETAHQMALEEGLYPLLVWIKGLMDRLIRIYFGYTDLEFLWDDQEATDPEIQAKIDDTNLKNGSAMINEVRAKRGDAPVDGGDVAMVLTATGYVPIIPKEPESTPPQLLLGAVPPPDPGATPPGAAPAPSTAAKAGSAAATPQAPAKKPAVAPAKPSAAATTKMEGGVDADVEGVYRRFQLVRKVAPKGVKRIKRDTKPRLKAEAVFTTNLHKQLGDQLKTLRTHVVSKVGKAAQPKPDAWVDDFEWKGWEEFQDLFGNYIVGVAKTGVDDAYVQINIDDPAILELANQDAIEYAATRSAELVGKRVDGNGNIVNNPNPAYSIEEATREMIRGDVTRAMEEGLSNDDLADLLTENYAFSEERAMTIARTETAAADTQGNLALYTRSGEVDQKRWIVGEGCCEECQEIDGEIVGLSENFSIGVDTPPAHPNCRCDFIPLLTQAEEDSPE